MATSTWALRLASHQAALEAFGPRPRSRRLAWSSPEGFCRLDHSSVALSVGPPGRGARWFSARGAPCVNSQRCRAGA
eukprot:11195735-Lingulodinium_polyedra.AAC.1